MLDADDTSPAPPPTASTSSAPAPTFSPPRPPPFSRLSEKAPPTVDSSAVHSTQSTFSAALPMRHSPPLPPTLVVPPHRDHPVDRQTAHRYRPTSNGEPPPMASYTNTMPSHNTSYNNTMSSYSNNIPIDRPLMRRQSTKVYGGLPPSADLQVNQLEAKVVILGSQGVGKTSLVHRYISGHFSYSLSSTIGASFLTKKLVVDGCKVRLQLWDTAGQERFRSMAPLYYRGALCAILVYDVTNQESFADIKVWLDELRRNMSSDLQIHVVGSKADLCPQHRAVNLVDARKAIAEWMLDDPTSQDLTRTPSSTTSATGRSPSPPSPDRAKSFVVSRSPPADTTTTTTAAATTPAVGARARKTSLGYAPYAKSGSAAAPALDHHHLGIGTADVAATRSESRLSLGISGLTRGRRAALDDDAAAHRKTRQSHEDDARRRAREVELTEVSAKDDYGIEDLFLLITRCLVEKKAQIEQERIARSRDSVMLVDHEPAGAQPSAASAVGWCC